MRTLSASVLVGSLLLTGGCSTTMAHLTIASTKTTDFSQPHRRAASEATASDGRLWLTILPLGSAPSVDKAMNHLLEEYNGDYLTDVEIIDVGWTLLAISYGSYSVKGDVWATAPPVSSPAPPSK